MAGRESFSREDLTEFLDKYFPGMLTAKEIRTLVGPNGMKVERLRKLLLDNDLPETFDPAQEAFKVSLHAHPGLAVHRASPHCLPPAATRQLHTHSLSPQLTLGREMFGSAPAPGRNTHAPAKLHALARRIVCAVTRHTVPPGAGIYTSAAQCRPLRATAVR